MGVSQTTPPSRSLLFPAGCAWSQTARPLLLTLILVYFVPISGHTRLECPPPRSKETGVKVGPCDAPDNPALPAYPLHPGLNTVTWLEALGHPGAPGRFALSLDGSDDGFEDCILLDHVPRDEHGQPTIANEASYHRSSITLYIPDVRCERCHLQFLTFMTDNFHELPRGEQCVYSAAQNAGKANATLPACAFVYHSCAPVSINGTVPRAAHTCSHQDHISQLDWPFMDGKPPASTYYFKGDPGLYENAQLKSGGAPITGCVSPFYCPPAHFYQATKAVPAGAKYAAPHGSCAAIVDMEVEPFVLGQLPSVPKSTATANGDQNQNQNQNSMTSTGMVQRVSCLVVLVLLLAANLVL